MSTSPSRAQKDLAAGVAWEYAGRRIWFTGHWGLQYYLEKMEAQAIDGDAGSEQLKRGDVVVIPSINDNITAGFYADGWGFLPYTISRKPLDVFESGIIQ